MVRALCRKTSPKHQPILIPVISSPKYPEGYCWENVSQHVAEFGGSSLNGWIIWEIPGFLVEAEFHQVWRNPEGELIDITQKGDGERSILFLPDDDKSPETGYWPNQRLYTYGHPLRAKHKAAYDFQDELRAKYYDKESKSWNIPVSEVRHLQELFDQI